MESASYAKIKVTAATGAAASIHGGTTLHSYLKATPKVRYSLVAVNPEVARVDDAHSFIVPPSSFALVILRRQIDGIFHSADKNEEMYPSLAVTRRSAAYNRRQGWISEEDAKKLAAQACDSNACGRQEGNNKDDILVIDEVRVFGGVWLCLNSTAWLALFTDCRCTFCTLYSC